MSALLTKRTWKVKVPFRYYMAAAVSLVIERQVSFRSKWKVVFFLNKLTFRSSNILNWQIIVILHRLTGQLICQMASPPRPWPPSYVSCTPDGWTSRSECSPNCWTRPTSCRWRPIHQNQMSLTFIVYSLTKIMTSETVRLIHIVFCNQQEPILPNFNFTRFLILVVKLESLQSMKKMCVLRNGQS